MDFNIVNISQSMAVITHGSPCFNCPIIHDPKSLIAFLLSGMTKYSKIMCIYPPDFRKMDHFSKKPWLLLVDSGI